MIAIIAILAAILAPVLVAAKAATKKAVAVQSGRQLWFATELYLGDHDDRFPPAISVVSYGRWQTWFGLSRIDWDWSDMGSNGGWDTSQGWLSPYRSDRALRDPSHSALPYLGDMSGFGYNYAYIGSDFQIKKNWHNFPDSKNPARLTELANTSNTVVYATSSFYYPAWAGGDGQVYDFGFIDPPENWQGNPNVDFRHHGSRKIDPVSKTAESDGQAVFIFADGHVRVWPRGRIEPEMFTRDQKNPNDS